MTKIKRASFIIMLVLSLWHMYPLTAAMASVGPFGGNIRSFAVDSANANTVYAGTAGAGVFKSTNGGSQWAAINTGLTTHFVWSLAIDPADSNTLYAGTWGNGIFVSYDGGQTWN